MSRLPGGPLCLALLLLALPAPAAERFALLVGANAGWADDRPLRYAELDAERLRDVLVELGGFPSERVVLLKDPDSATLRAQLARLSEQVKALGDTESLVVFYYSGHADPQHLHLRGPPLSHGELFEALRDLPATVRLGVLDACRSGSILQAKGGRRAASFEVRVVDELRVRGLALLTSSGADEFAQERAALTGSVFSLHLVSGLRGAADYDADGAVTLSEVYRYARQHTEVDTSSTAKPHIPAFLYDLAGQGEPILTRPSAGQARLLLPQGEGERYVVLDAHGLRLVAEGRTRPDERVEIALAPGTYQVTHVQAEALRVAPLSLQRSQREPAERLAYTTRPLSTGLLKGRPEELDPEALREWRRGEALRQLDEGKLEEALKLFHQVLAQHPGDAGARRGEARTLVRMADAEALGGRVEREQVLLREALEREPSLAEDPDFARRYQRLGELKASQERAQGVRAELEHAAKENPYLLKRWGIGLDLLSSRGFNVLSGMLRLDESWLLGAAFSVNGLSLDVELRYLPTCQGSIGTPTPDRTEVIPWAQVCPVLGWGLSLSALDVLGEVNVPLPRLAIPTTSALGQALATSRLHASGGLLFMNREGFFFGLEVGVMLYRHKSSGQPGLIEVPGVRVGFLSP
jgi:tetratricopeptide (TPR) repeat protein